MSCCPLKVDLWYVDVESLLCLFRIFAIVVLGSPMFFLLLLCLVLFFQRPSFFSITLHSIISIAEWSVDYSYPSIALILVPSGLTAPPIIPQALLGSDFIEGNELPWPPLDVNDRRVPSLDCYFFIPVLVSPMVFIEDYLAIPRSKIILFIFQS